MKELEKAFEMAKKAHNQAYAPYSKFKVGATVISKDGRFFSGHNVENASYGGAICAERVAILKAVSDDNPCREFSKMVLVTEPIAHPCGLCLQTMSEFCEPDFEIHLSTIDGIKEMVKFKDLLARPFGPKDLKVK